MDSVKHLGPGGATKDGYTVFGEVIQGMEVVDRMTRLPTEEQNGLRMLVTFIPFKMQAVEG